MQVFFKYKDLIVFDTKMDSIPREGEAITFVPDKKPHLKSIVNSVEYVVKRKDDVDVIVVVLEISDY